MSDWPLLYLGHRYQADGTGPAAWNCWTFFLHVQSTHYGRDLPPMGVDPYRYREVVRRFRADGSMDGWERISGAEEGCAVVMGMSVRDPCHVGIWSDIDGGRVVHCTNGAGVCLHSVGTVLRAYPRPLEYFAWRG